MVQAQDCSKCPTTKKSAFACLKSRQCSRLSKVSVPHLYRRGQMICYAGTPALAVFCVRSGLLKLVREVNHSDTTVIALQTAGDLIGYRAVLADLPYGVSAQTVEPSVVCTIPREDFLALIEESSELASHLLKRLAHEFCFAEDELVSRGGEKVATRTARFLVRLAESANPRARRAGHVPPPMRREDLAQLLGTTPETLSRTLHDFAKRGLVEIDGKEIRVLDLTRLKRLAD